MAAPLNQKQRTYAILRFLAVCTMTLGLLLYHYFITAAAYAEVL
jgi:hypothetical protein